jgi:hypothetical protein
VNLLLFITFDLSLLAYERDFSVFFCIEDLLDIEIFCFHSFFIAYRKIYLILRYHSNALLNA